ncbi:hypothetical protein HMPREF1212_01355 [Parabacteroides sp. HGS0025]|uniref:GIY-YIG nuclease family protein n=1 Tax=Parabacteroides sp. HGS0025 TaxID=1078087 RepID=UPI0006176647|nr:GIY-YIG nuclease family protein [Parabacteroides sp. HGS0025]KKB53192.1 hypothetical protein HMPREF1212_01355 [Parabacteroides sp. HGS0025]
MLSKILLNYEFKFIQNLSPEANENGDIIEFRPQELFTKKDIIPLHKHGSGTFCHFSIDKKWNGLSGVYAFYIDDQMIYIGKCQDLGNRFNQGYGCISPKNCFQGGQSTNCKLNKVILEAIKKQQTVTVYFHETPNFSVIESDLINYYHPMYNIQIPNKVSMNNKNNIINKTPMLIRIKEIIGYIKKYICKDKYIKSQNIIKKPQAKKTKNASVENVREYIRNSINKAKNSGESEIKLKSGDIHKELKMNNAMPTVCNAMKTLGYEYSFEIQQQPPKGYGSNLIIMYKIQ